MDVQREKKTRTLRKNKSAPRYNTKQNEIKKKQNTAGATAAPEIEIRLQDKRRNIMKLRIQLVLTCLSSAELIPTERNIHGNGGKQWRTMA